MEIRVLTAADVRQCLAMPEAIRLMEKAFTALSDGTMDCPVRTLLSNENGTVLYKPAYWDDAKLFCCKTVSVFAGNAKRSLPVTAGLIHVNDAETGLPIALMDAGFITSLRTGAATGLATRLLAHPQARTAALFGAGGQAGHELEALLAVRDLSTCYVFAGSTRSAESFCAREQESAGDCRLVPATSNRVLGECDIIVTATTHGTPLFAHDDLKERVHINAIGSLGPTRREVPTDTVLAAGIVVDQRAACLAEGGEFLIVEQEGKLPGDFRPVELGELIDGTCPVPDSPVTLFKSVGNAAQDIVCVERVLAVAAQQDLGQMIDVFGSSPR